METQHKVFPVGAGRDSLAVHVCVSVAGVQIEIHAGTPLPRPVIRMPLRTAAWWAQTATICRGVGPSHQRVADDLGMSQGKQADLVEWAVGTPLQHVTVTFPRETWVSICQWVAARLEGKDDVGGESGPGARACDIGWLDDIRRQCQSADVPVFIKQLGASPYTSNVNLYDWPGEEPSDNKGLVGSCAAWLHLRDRKGGDMAEWPKVLRVREYPRGIE